MIYSEWEKEMESDRQNSSLKLDEIPSEVANLEDKYILRLFVNNKSSESRLALKRLYVICEEHLHGRYELEVIDIYQHPEQLEREKIAATPTLLKQLPYPFHRLIGDLSDTEQVLMALNI